MERVWKKGGMAQINVVLWNLPGRRGKTPKLKVRMLVSGPRFDPGTSQVQSRSFNVMIVIFGQWRNLCCSALTYLMSTHVKFVVDKLAVRQIFHPSISVFLHHPAHAFIKVLVCSSPDQLQMYHILGHSLLFFWNQSKDVE